jgi:uncharacterized repeat protein (TIGR03803 family)
MRTTSEHAAQIAWTCLSGATAVLALAVAMGAAMIAAPSAQAQTFRLLHSFTGADGAGSSAALVADAAGNLYGTTQNGGPGACNDGYGVGCGVLFTVDKTGTVTVLHNFTGGTDGANPGAALIRDAAGNFYGTTLYGGGGTLCRSNNMGCGTVFKLDAAGTETVLYSFTGGADGANPFTTLVRDRAGDLYGTTSIGGTGTFCNSGKGCGTVFKVSMNGQEKVLYSFTGGTDGGYPSAGLVWVAGTAYGTTGGGGERGSGTVFALKGGKESVLYSFTGYRGDGSSPQAALLIGVTGTFYSTTFEGGLGSCPFGCGTVYVVNRTGKETPLYMFAGPPDGAYPQNDLLVQDAAGNLYGTTELGGDPSCAGGCGTVFKLDKTGKETVLHRFNGGDGQYPLAGLHLDAAGNLYGTTSQGGTYGNGTVFEIKP